MGDAHPESYFSDIKPPEPKHRGILITLIVLVLFAGVLIFLAKGPRPYLPEVKKALHTR